MVGSFGAALRAAPCSLSACLREQMNLLVNVIPNLAERFRLGFEHIRFAI